MALFDPTVSMTALPRTCELRGIETASSTWHRGAPLVWASGKLAEASANPRDIAAFAASPASGTTDAEVIAIRALAAGLIHVEICLDKAGGLATVPLAQTHVGAVYGITKSAGGIWYLDIDKVTAGTNTVLLIEELLDPIGAKTNDTPTDKNTGGARVRCIVLVEATAAGTAAA